MNVRPSKHNFYMRLNFTSSSTVQISITILLTSFYKALPNENDKYLFDKHNFPWIFETKRKIISWLNKTKHAVDSYAASKG